MTDFKPLLAEQFLERHCEEWQEDGYDFTDFREGHEIENLDLLSTEHALYLRIGDEGRQLLIFKDGSSFFHDEAGAVFEVHGRNELVGVLIQMVETELSFIEESVE